MTTYACIQNNVAVDVFIQPAGFTLAECFHPEVAAQFSAVPDGTVVGSTLANGVWTAPPVQPEPPTQPVPYAPRYVAPAVFKLFFTMAEEIAIYTSTDPGVQRFVAMVDDPKTAEIDLSLPAVIERITYLSTLPTTTPPGALPLSAMRLAQVLSGTLQ